jgi:GntR family transcriptional regulator, transcriptional repressor for pyruvate dehydrogenase complex
VRVSRTSLIAPLRSAGRAEEVALRLTEAIHLGILHDGQQLPSEAEFAQQLGVSPMTLREAIATLREQGLVETRRGRSGGTFVRRALEPPVAPDRRRLQDMTVSTLRDMADELAAVSGAAARLAADRCTPSDLRKLFSLVDQMASATTRGSRMKADSRFHVEVAMTSQSERLTRHEVRLQGEIAGLLWLDMLPDQEVRSMAREHHEIATAVAEEDGDFARRLAERHVRRNLRRVIAMHLELVDTRITEEDTP